MKFVMRCLMLAVWFACQECGAVSAAEPANASKSPKHHFPAVWGKGLGTLPEHSFQTASARSKHLNGKAMKKVMNEEYPQWLTAFKNSMNYEITREDVLLFVIQFDPYWEEGAHQAALLYECRSRVARLSGDTVRTWQTALSDKVGDTVDFLAMTGYLIQSGKIHPRPEGTFSVAMAAQLLDRLNGLPLDKITAWKDAAGLDTDQAAMSLIEADGFFDNQNAFLEPPFQAALAELKASAPQENNKRGGKGKPKAGNAKPAHGDREKVAEGKLKLAKSLLKTKPSAAKERLERIVKDFAGTKAAQEASDLLTPDSP